MRTYINRATVAGGTAPALWAFGIGALVALIASPAQANPNKAPGTACGNCHDGYTEPNQNIYVGIDGVETTSATVVPGQSFEVDWIATGMRGENGSGRGISGYFGATAATWTVSPTLNASNPASLGGITWHTNWDNIAAGSTAAAWIDNATDESGSDPDAPPAGYYPYVIDFQGSPWHNNTGSTFDDGSGGDPDGVADQMGFDTRITVPAGATPGPYTMWVAVVGHNCSGGSCSAGGGNEQKATIFQIINLTVSGGANTAPDTTIDALPGTIGTTSYTLTGTATDPDGPEVTAVKLTIQQNGGDYWNGSAWQPGAIEVDAASTSGDFDTWSYGWNNFGTLSGVTVNVQARAYDGTDYDATPAADSTVVDNASNTEPDTTIDPLPGTMVLTSFSITGTAADPDGPEVTAVKVTIQQNGGDYWNGTAWQPGAIEVDAASTSGDFDTWSYGWNNFGVLSGVTVNVQARAFDGVAYDPTPAVDSTVVDNNTAPDTAIDALPGTIGSTSYTLTGTATDPNGADVSQVYLTIQQNGGDYWNGSAWQPGATEVTATSTSGDFDTWSYGWNNFGTLSGVTVNVQARAWDGIDYDPTPAADSTVVDNAGNTEPDTTIDALPGTMVLTSFTITGTANDPDGPDVTAVKVTIQQNGGDYWNGSAWQPGAIEVDAASTSGDFDTWSYSWNNFGAFSGVTVNVQARAFDGSAYDPTPAVDSTVVDNNTAPDTTIDALPGTLGTTSYTVTGTAADPDGADVSAVKLTISRPGPEYWNGSAWQPGAVEVDAGSTSGDFDTWSYGWNNFGTMSGVTVTVQARAFDGIDYDASPAVDSTVVDNAANTAPDTTLNALPASLATTSYTATGTANDPDGPDVTAVKVTIQRQDNSDYWNGSAWQGGAIEVDASSTSGDFDTWSYAWNNFGTMSSVVVDFSVRAYDGVDYDPSPATDSTTVDNTVPDTDAPCASANLRVDGATRTATTLDLQFDAPFEDCVGSAGTPVTYMVRYSDTAIVDQTTWDAAEVFDDNYPASAGAGALETVTVTPLESNHFYFFQVKAVDDALNVGPLGTLQGANSNEARTYLHLGWNIASVRGLLGATNQCQDVFGVPECYPWVSTGPSDWAGNYVPTGPTGVVQNGVAYFITVSSSTFDLPLVATGPTVADVQVPLSKGMNLVSSPHDKPVTLASCTVTKTNGPTNTLSFNDAVLAGWIENAVWSYDGTNYLQHPYNGPTPGTLGARKGVWLKLIIDDANTYAFDLVYPGP